MDEAQAMKAENDEWRALVGTAIVCFGDLELITIKCLAHIPHDRIAETASRLPFARRVDLLVEIIEGRGQLPSSITTFLSQLKRARKLAEVRNVIAHNPVMLNLYLQRGTGDVHAERSIAAARREGLSIDLASLKEFAAEVEDLASALWLQIGKLIEELEQPARGGETSAA